MKEAGTRNIRHWGPDLLASVNHIHTERIDGIATDVVSVDTRNQHLALVVVHKKAANHFGGWLHVSCFGLEKKTLL